jgi:hypothetical protein
MTEITIGGRAFELAPFRLGGLRRAAAYLDRINARAATFDPENPLAAGLEGALDSARDMCEVLAIALMKVDPACTADWIEEQLGIDDILELQQQFREVLIASGLAKKGEAQAVSEPAGAETVEPEAGALESNSLESSPS